MGWVHWQLEELLQGHRGGAWVHEEVGRGDGAPCQPGWHRQDRGLPTVASTTPLFLRLRLRVGFVGVMACCPQGPGLLPWFRGEADSMPAALSYSGSREEHVLDRFNAGRDWAHEEGGRARPGAVTLGRKADFSGGLSEHPT